MKSIKRFPNPVILIVLAILITSVFINQIPVTASDQKSTVQVENLGPAVKGSPINTAELLGNKIYVVTRGLSPAILGVYNYKTGKVVNNISIPTGAGAWASTSYKQDVYIGTYGQADLYKLQTDTQKLTKVAGFPGASFIMDLATAKNGEIYAGTYPNSKVYKYNAKTGKVQDLGVAVPGESYVRSIAVDKKFVYAGVGSHAHLIAINRDTGAKQDILPQELSGDSFVYSLAVSNKYIVGGTEPSGKLFIINKDNFNDYQIIAPETERTIDQINIQGSKIFFTARLSGSLYRYDIADNKLTKLATPTPHREHRGLFVLDKTIIGAAGSGAIWKYDRQSGQSSVTNLAEAGLYSLAESPQSIAATDARTVYVSGHFQLKTHHLDSNTTSWAKAAGEPKVMVTVGQKVYMGIYPGALVSRYDPQVGKAEIIADIGKHQNRPLALHYSRSSKKLLVGTRPEYGLYGGALTVVDPKSGDHTVYRNVIQNQTIRSVTSNQNIAYVGSSIRGGIGTNPIAKEAHVAAFNFRTGKKLWEITPVENATAITGLIFYDSHIFGMTNHGVLFEINPLTQQVVYKEKVLGRGSGEMVIKNNKIFGVNYNQVYRFDPETHEFQTIIKGLKASWYSFPQIANIKNSNLLFTVKGRDLIRVSLPVTAANMKTYIHGYEKQGAFANHGAARSLQAQLDAVIRFKEK